VAEGFAWLQASTRHPCIRTVPDSRARLIRAGAAAYFVFSLPLGRTAVVGGTGLVDTVEESFGGLVSFFGFFAILLLRCSPLGMLDSSWMSSM
jgi:hypothetical protein